MGSGRVARMSRCGAALSVLCGLSTPLAAAAPTAPAVSPVSAANPRSASPVYDFDIPVLPLVQALDRYAALTQRPALFSSEAVAGRTSSPVFGRYTPEAALLLLLEGTGLVAEVSQAGPADAFILKTVPSETLPVQAARQLGGDYPGLLQARLWSALCRDVAARPGSYRALLRFEVDRSGAIRRVRLLGSTGDASRDIAVRAVLAQVRLEDPPPAAMPQPVTMIVLPDTEGPGGFSARCNDGVR